MPQTVNGYTIPAGSDAVSTIDDTMATFAGQFPAQGTVASTSGLGLALITPTSIANSGGTASLTGGAATFSGVSSISLNGCFTSSYENYRVIWYCNPSVDGNTLVRLRASGTDDSSANYDEFRDYGGTGAAARYNAQTSWGNTFIFGQGSPNTSFAITHFLRPQKAAPTMMSATVNYAASGAFPLSIVTVASHRSSTAYDGFSLIQSSGTLTGTIRVYGYKD